MKQLLKSLIVSILGWQVRRLRQKHDFKVIGVVGSIGKTSTKFAIASVLQSQYRVRYQEGNYNDIVTVPLIFFGQAEPSLFNPFAWLRTLLANERQLRVDYPFDVVVAEIGTDAPGQIAAFKQYLHCDIAVVTALTMEHMENFRDLDHVASEELSVSKYADTLVANFDLCLEEHLREVSVPIVGYGKEKSHYQMKNISFNKDKSSFVIVMNKTKELTITLDAVSIGEFYSAAAAAAVADMLHVPGEKIAEAIESLKPVSGRMQRLAGIEDSLILDESYNASPAAVKAALDGLYMLKGQQKIALLGNMNELGKFSAEAHREIGEYCDPTQLDLLVTLGPDANKYLAPAAEAQGCTVATFTDPYAAGDFIKEQLRPGSIILVKGSQNKVYAEEAIKPLLADPSDEAKLVRQSPEWLKKKKANFSA